MTISQKDAIRKVQGVLQSIDNGTPSFFNVAQYENLGLVQTRKKWRLDSVGNKVDVGYTFHLTSKGRMYLNTVV